MRTPIVLGLLTAFAAPGHALVGGFDDLRFSYQLPLTTAKAKVEDEGNSANSGTAKDAWDSASRIGVDYVGSFSAVVVGVVYGVGITADLRSGDAGNRELDYQAYSGHVRLGPYWSILDIIALELTATAGVGLATLQEQGGGRNASTTDLMQEYGAHLDCIVAVPGVGLVAGAGVAYVQTGSEHQLSQTNTTTTYDLRGGSWLATVQLGYRF